MHNVRACLPCDANRAHSRGVATGARPGWPDVLVFLGASVTVYGIGLLSVAAAVIGAGLLLVALGVLAAHLYG